MRIRTVVVALLVVAGCALAGFGAARLFAVPAPVSADLAVQERLMCPQCQGVRLDVCDRPICDDMRSDIHRRLGDGESQEAIVHSYAAIYGPAVLATGSTTTNSALVPWLFVILGLLMLGSLALGRGVAPEPAPPGPNSVPSPQPLVDRELASWREGR